MSKADNEYKLSFWGIVPPALLVMFVFLKLLGEITWSWWWVLSPLLLPLGLLAVVFLLIGVLDVYEDFRRERDRREEFKERLQGIYREDWDG